MQKYTLNMLISFPLDYVPSNGISESFGSFVFNFFLENALNYKSIKLLLKFSQYKIIQYKKYKISHEVIETCLKVTDSNG
jgi:hypothetical protein